MRVNSKQSLFESFMNDVSNSKTLQGENVDKFLRKYNSIYNDSPIIKDGKLYIDNIRLRGSGISKGVEVTFKDGIMEVYNEEWGFTYDGSTVSNVEDMSQYWFYDDYENNEEFHNKIDSAARSLYKDVTELAKSSLTESDEIDHLIQRGDVYIPVRRGQTEKEALDNLERLGGMNDVPPTEEELATGKYRPVAKYVYQNGLGGLMTGEYEKVEDNSEELTETTNKGIKAKQDDLYARIRQAQKDAGFKDWEKVFGYSQRLPKDQAEAFDKESDEISCIRMIHSILTYSSPNSVENVMNNEYDRKYLDRYIDTLGEDKVRELIANEIEEYKNATINQNVYTDSEGVTYNSVTFKDDLDEEDKLTEGTKAKRISHYGEFDNGHVFHKWYEMSDEEAENQAKQMSIEHPDDVWYVAYDDVMNPGSTKRWFRGKEYSESKGYDIYCKVCRNGFNVKSPEEQNKILSDLGLDESDSDDLNTKESNKLKEAIERKYEKSNPDYNSRKNYIRKYTGSYTYLFSGKVSTEYNGDPITIDYFYYERPYDRTTYNLVVNVLTPLGNYDGEYIQEAIENEWYNTDTKYTRLSQKEIKEKILQVVSSLN